MKAKIIIVEDHEPIRNELKILLSKYGYEIIVLDRFDTVVEECLREDVDLILLDINLPFYDGYYVCRAIREKSEVPIIVVTSRDSEMDELMSINLGADDFITKPYNTQILLARISAMLKRTHKEKVNDFLQYQGLKLQLNSSTVIYKDQIIELSKNEMRILYTLLQHKESIVSRDQLMESLWQSNEFIDDNTLTVNVNRVRKKLEAAGLKVSVKTKYSTDVAKGKVISQSPGSGNQVTKNSTVVITVSQGEKPETMVRVPNLRYFTESGARSELKNSNLVLGSVLTEYSDSVEKGLVIRQTVSSGSKVKEGTAVGIYVSLGPRQTATTADQDSTADEE